MIDKMFERKDRHSAVVEVTPALAERWLTECNTHNRKLVDAHVERLAHEIEAGRWRLTHQGIAFNEHRVLIDGQHRLWAVVLAGRTVSMRVFFNEPVESLQVVDVLRPRSNDEVITLSGTLGLVTKLDLATLRAMVFGLATYERMTPGAEAELLQKHRAAIEFAHEAMSGARRFRGVATGVTRGVIARAYYSADHAKLRHFGDVLLSGMATGEDDQPILLLFKFLIETTSRGTGKPETRERYGKTERALHAYLCGQKLGRLYASTCELFLLPDEVVRRSAS